MNGESDGIDECLTFELTSSGGSSNFLEEHCEDWLTRLLGCEENFKESRIFVASSI